MGSFRFDLRDAARSLLRTPGYAALVIVTLGLGIGVNTAVFTIVDALVLKPLPYREPDRIVRVAEWPETGGNYTVSPAAYLRWRDSVRAFSHFEARVSGSFALLDGGPPEELRGARVTPGYFELLGVLPAIGRGFQPADARPGEPCTVVISHRLWMDRFGGERATIGSTVRFSGRTCTLIGVLPADSVFDRGALEVYAPLAFAAADGQRYGRILTVLARLGPGTSLAGARDEMVRLARDYYATRGAAGRGWTSAVTPLQEVVVRADSRQLASVMFGAVAVVLLVACLNVAGLSLSRTLARQREIAVRAALGASHGRMFRYLISESLLLAGAGGAVGLLLGSWVLRLFTQVAPAGTLPAETIPTLDGRALLFTLVTAVVTGLLLGAASAWRGTRTGPAAALAAGGRAATASPSVRRVQNLLVATEVSLAMILVIAATSLVVSFIRLTAVDPGFAPERVLTARITLPQERYSSPDQVTRGYLDVLDAIRRIPGVEHAGAVTSLPLGGWLFGTTFSVIGAAVDPAATPSAHIQHATHGYIEALHIPLVAGRTFAPHDHARAPRVAIVNETFVQRYVPDGAAVGRQLRLGSSGSSSDAPWEIVGVVGDVKTGGLADGELATPEIYVPHPQAPMASMFIAVRVAADRPAGVVPGLREAVRSVDAELPLSGVLTMDERLGGSVRRERFRTAMIGASAVLALLLSSVGVYAVRSQSVVARFRELGIRLALGATPRDLLRMVLQEGLRPVALGLGAGLLGSWWFTRFVEPWLFATSSTDPIIIAMAAALFGVAALIASLAPARRAAAVDPVSLLRLDT